jgi:hypothetical protein
MAQPILARKCLIFRTTRYGAAPGQTAPFDHLSRYRPNVPFAELVRLSRTSIADEMLEEHHRRVRGRMIDRSRRREAAFRHVFARSWWGSQTTPPPMTAL